jgi:protease IV
MKQFFKMMFASILGVIFGMILLFFITAGLVAAIVSASGDKQVKVEPATVLHIKFKGPLQDRTSDNPFENFDLNSLDMSGQPGLNDITKNLKKAASDNNISGIYLDLSGLEGGLASVEELRSALLEFKKSKKFILAYSDFYTQSSYYVASAADQIWINPSGVVDFRGFAATLPFLKGLFAKLDIEPQVIKHGKFKSAAEPFIMDKMSEENKAQIKSYIDSFWDHTVSEISFSRNIPKDSLHLYAERMDLQTPEDALRLGFIDKIGYMDEFITLLKEKTATADDKEVKTMSLKKYTKAPETGPAKEFTRDKIAVIFASGGIVDGKGESGEIGSESLSATIRKARKDEKVKAMVLRVNSPGGSALASEVIWREVELSRKVKPVIVSMGDVAASGGYYISCAADKIVAQPNTVTGSIGVIGLLFNLQKMFNNKLGITFDRYKTGEFADFANATRPLTQAERSIIERAIERVYGKFTQRVADGRKITVDQVDSLGQGRVWSGVEALQNGLVDTLGGLADAIKIAATAAGLENYRITELPESKDPFQQLLKELEGEAATRWMRFHLGEDFDYHRMAHEVRKMQGIQAWSGFQLITD